MHSLAIRLLCCVISLMLGNTALLSWVSLGHKMISILWSCTVSLTTSSPYFAESFFFLLMFWQANLFSFFTVLCCRPGNNWLETWYWYRMYWQTHRNFCCSAISCWNDSINATSQVRLTFSTCQMQAPDTHVTLNSERTNAHNYRDILKSGCSRTCRFGTFLENAPTL